MGTAEKLDFALYPAHPYASWAAPAHPYFRTTLYFPEPAVGPLGIPATARRTVAAGEPNFPDMGKRSSHKGPAAGQTDSERFLEIPH